MLAIVGILSDFYANCTEQFEYFACIQVRNLGQ